MRSRRKKNVALNLIALNVALFIDDVTRVITTPYEHKCVSLTRHLRGLSNISTYGKYLADTHTRTCKTGLINHILIDDAMHRDTKILSTLSVQKSTLRIGDPSVAAVSNSILFRPSPLLNSTIWEKICIGNHSLYYTYIGSGYRIYIRTNKERKKERPL